MDLREQFALQKTVKTSEGDTYLSLGEQFKQQKDIRDASGITELLKANIADPDEASAVAGMTYTLADHFKEAPITILQDLSGWAARYNGAIKDNKTAWQQIWDGAKTGWATDRLGLIGSALMGDRTPEERQQLNEEAARIRASIPGTEGNSDGFFVKMGTSTANLLGTMIRPLITNLLVSAILPEAKIGAVMGTMAKKVPAIAAKADAIAATATKVVGHGVSAGVTWAQTAEVEAGNIYLDMLDAGVDEGIAKKYANIHGVIAGALEAAPLEFAFAKFPFLKNISKNAFNKLCGRTISKVGVAKTMSGALAGAFVNMAASDLFETVTEVAQEGSAVYFEKKAALALPDEVKDEKLRKMLPEVYGQWRAYYEQEVADRKDYYESQEYKDYVADRVWDVAVQTALGTAPLSFFGASGQVIADVRYTRNIKKEAEVNPSKLDFIKRHFNDKQFAEIPREKRGEALAQMYEENHTGKRIDAVDASTLDTDYLPINEGSMEGEEEASQTPTTPIKRRQDNRLHIQEAIDPELTVEHDDGSVTKYMKLGSAENEQRYGHIKFTVNNDANEITINDVKMRAGQQELTEEFITDFMERYKGYNIEWNPTSPEQQKVKDSLLEVNKDTKYEGQLQQFWGKGDREQINKAAKIIKSKFKNFTPDQAMVGAEVLNLMAQNRHKPLSQLLSDVGENGDIRLGTFQEGIEAGVLDPEELVNKKGAIQWAAEAGKVFIWVGEKGDMSTLNHEVTHFALMTDPEAAAQLAKSLKEAADTPQFRQYIDEHREIIKHITENRVSLTRDQIIEQIKSMSDDVNQWSDIHHEIVAVLGETYFQEGRTFNPELKSIFDKIVDWFLKIYGLLKREALLNDNIIKAYDNLFAGNPELKEKYDSQQQAETQTETKTGTHYQNEISEADIAEADAQYKEIESQYKGTPEWLKAPNGQPTNLTERQWVQVRTPNFKAWFGDWENDPDNASEVVDENGEPLVVYHATRRGTPKFDVFEDRFGEGLHFGTKEQAKNRSKGRLYAAFLNIRNMERRYDEGNWWYSVKYHSDDVDGFIYDNEAEGEGDSYVVFSPEQIKSATDNVGTFSQSNPSILFQTDTEYLDAVNSGDMAKAQAMVDQRAREMGYNSPRLYHGTKQFGFTEIDKNKLDDKRSFFATTSPEVAQTYSGKEDERQIGKRNNDIKGELAKIDKDMKNYARKVIATLKKLDDKHYSDLTINDILPEGYLEEKREYELAIMGNRVINTISDMFDWAVENNEELKQLSKEKLANTDVAKKLDNLKGDLYDALNKIGEIQSTQGNYALYAKTDNLMEIDAEGGSWDEIKIPDNIIDELKTKLNFTDEQIEDLYRTREIADIAEQLGYSGVHFTDLYDDGGRGEYEQEFPADVYIFFNPQSQVKSADPVTYDDNGQVIPLSQRFNDSHSSLLFQSAYHGSGASFDKFDTDFMGTGEGAQAFGWGIYLTQSEGIARSYAENNQKHKSKYAYYTNGNRIVDEDLIEALNIGDWEKNDVKSELSILIDFIKKEISERPKWIENIDKAIHKIEEGANADDNLLKWAKEEVKDDFVIGAIRDVQLFNKNDSADLKNTILIDYLSNYKKRQQEYIEWLEDRKLKFLESLQNSSFEVKLNPDKPRNLYTVTIPDDTGNNYLYWDKEYTEEEFDKLAERVIKANNLEGKWGTGDLLPFDVEGEDEFNRNPTGEEIYHAIQDTAKNPKTASQYLNKAGFVGIDYPANSMSGGNKYGKRNFVIFNADDITIDNHLLWQEMSPEEIENDLLDQAKGETLEDWIEFNKWMGTESLNEDQLKAIWEKANNMQKTAEGETVIPTETMTEDEKDTAFYNLMQTDDGIRGFIQALRYIYNFQDEVDRYGSGDEDANYLKRVEDTLKLAENAAPKITMIASGKTPIEKIDPSEIKNIRGMVVNSIRDYRNLYATATGREDLSVDSNALPFIAEPTADIKRMSFAERKRLADKIEAESLKKKLMKGNEPIEVEAQKVIKYLDDEIKNGKKKIEEQQEDIIRKREALSMKDKKLLKNAEEMKEAEQALNKLNAKIRAKLDKGVRISTEEYKRRDSLMERIEVLKEATSQLIKQEKVKALLDKQEALQKLKDKYKNDMEQRRLAREIIDYKKKLWRGINRKVSKNVYWEQAEAIKALQQLLSGVSESTNENITVNGKRMTLKAFREGIEDGTIDVAGLSNYQLKRYLNKNLADFTINELEELYDTVRYLTLAGRQEWQAKVDKRNYEAQQYRNILINEIISSPKFKGNEPLPETTEAIKKSRNLMDMVKTAWYKTLNMARKAQILDNGRKAMAYRLLISEKRDIQDAEYRAIRKRIKKVNDLMEKLNVKPEDFYEQFTLDIKGVKDSTYTVAQLIYGIKAQLEERNRQAFAYGNLVNQIEKSNYTDEQIKDIGDARYKQFTEQAQKILDGKENIMKIAEAIWEDWQDKDNFNRLNEAAVEEYNMPVDPVQFYMPIARKDFNGTELAQKIANDIFNQNAGKNMTSVENGMLQSRITISPRNQQPVDSNYFKLWSDSVAEQEHFIATNAYVRKLNRIFKAHGSKDLQAYIQSVYGNGMLTDINNYINEVANPEIDNDTQGINKFLAFMRGALYPAYLAFKASSVILQMITSPAPFLREVGPIELAKGLIQMSMHPVETWKYVTGLSAFMENRSMNPFVEEIKKHSQDYSKSKLEKGWDKFREVGTIGLEMADKWAVTAGWLAVYDKKYAEFIESGMTEEQAQVKAVKYADDVVYETQPLGDKTELAPLFKAGGPAMQAFTQFQVSLNVIWNNLTYDVAVGDISGHEYRKMVGTIMGYALAGVILYSVQDGWWDDDDDTTEEKLLSMLRSIAYGSTTQFTSAVPLLSNNADAIVKKMITGEKWQRRSSQLYPGLDELAMGVSNADWKKILSGAAKIGGAPVSGSKELMHVFFDKNGKARFYPQAFLGRREKK